MKEEILKVIEFYLMDELRHLEEWYELEEELPQGLNEIISLIEEKDATNHIAYSLLKLQQHCETLPEIGQVEVRNKMLCVMCGSENINEERLLSMRVNSQTIIEDHLIDYYCKDCGDVVDIIEDQEYKKQNNDLDGK